MKRLSARLTVMFALLCFLVLVCIGLLTGWVYRTSITDEKIRQFEQLVLESRRQYNNYVYGETSKEEMENVLSGMGALTDSRVFLITVTLDRLADTYDKNMRDLEIEFGGRYMLADDLRTIFRTAQPVFHPDVNWLSRNKQVMFYAAHMYQNGGQYSAVLIYGYPQNTEQAITQMWRAIWIWTLIATVATAVLALVISRRIAKPLRKMSKAARKLADGEEVEDITVSSRDEVGVLANSFNRMKKTLSSTERMRRNFLANVSHDMRTPLTSMLGLIEGLRAGWVPQESRAQVLDTLKSETERLVRLTGDILALARMQGGSIQLHPTVFRLYDLLREAQQALDPDGQRIQLEETGIVMQADRAQLHRAVYNIMQNATKYGDGTVNVNALEGDGRILIRIHDHGEGIPPEQLEQMFERFYRGDSARGSGGGSGLGLSIAREIIRLHGGDIEAESGHNGTTFTLWCPQNRKGRSEEM